MAKRLTDTNKWNDPWFRKLSPTLKLGFLYLLDGCNHAGIIDLDRDLADFQIGVAVEWSALIDGDRVIELPCRKLWIVKFCQFQYSNGLTKTSQIHRSVIAELAKYNLIPRLPQGFVNPCKRIKDKVKDKDKDKKEDNGPSDFEKFWSVVHRKVGKDEAKKAYSKAVARLRKELPEGTDPHEFLHQTMRTFAASPAATPTEHTPINPSTWLNQGRYSDDQSAWNGRPDDKTAAIAKSRADSLKSHAELQRTKAEAERVASESRKRAEALEAKFGASLDLLTSEEIRHLARSSLEDSEAAMLLKSYHGGPPGKLLRAALLESLSTAKAPA